MEAVESESPPWLAARRIASANERAAFETWRTVHGSASSGIFPGESLN
jgi:hypothetical protein